MIPRMVSRRRSRLAAGVLALAVGANGCTSMDRPRDGAGAGTYLRDTLGAAGLDEISGLAASRRADDLYWAHNDSGGEPVLFALDGRGQPRGAVRLVGVQNVDWEDAASFEVEGEAWLLVADVGDNAAVRRDLRLVLVREPDPRELSPDRILELSPALQIPVRYPEGPADVESVAVDPIRREILLVSKRTQPPRLYRLPLVLHPAEVEGIGSAEPLGVVAHLPEPDPLQRLIPSRHLALRSWPTGLDVSADGTTAVLLTYGEAWKYRREPDEDWAAAFAREPEALPPHQLTQAEAIAISRDGRSVVIASEGAYAPWLRWQREPES